MADPVRGAWSDPDRASDPRAFVAHVDRASGVDAFREYKRRIGLTLPPEKVLPVLKAARLFGERPDGTFGFAYQFAYFYFVDNAYLARENRAAQHMSRSILPR